MSTLTPELQREKEKLLWEELRDLRDVALRLLQWGVTVLASLQTAIFFLRKDVYERMLASKELTPDHHLPWNRYLVGTVFLFILASIFTYLLILVGNRYRKLREQLVATNLYQIEHGDAKKSARWVTVLVFFIFPLLDVFVRFYFNFIHVDMGFK